MSEIKKYNIRELSAMFQLQSSTIRYYEEVGILTHIERTTSGQRIFTENHVNRLKTICCFKNAGMTISELQKFFTYEADESQHLEDILQLLQDREKEMSEQMLQMEKAHAHILRKLHYYSDIKSCTENQLPLPQWDDYRDKTFSNFSKNK